MVVRWIPAHYDVLGNEVADKFATAAAEGTAPDSPSAVADRLRWETSLSHMARVSTEERSRAATQWISERLEDP